MFDHCVRSRLKLWQATRRRRLKTLWSVFDGLANCSNGVRQKRVIFSGQVDSEQHGKCWRESWPLYSFFEDAQRKESGGRPPLKGAGSTTRESFEGSPGHKRIRPICGTGPRCRICHRVWVTDHLGATPRGTFLGKASRGAGQDGRGWPSYLSAESSSGVSHERTRRWRQRNSVRAISDPIQHRRLR
jgi:hypothetical protein